MPATGGIPGDGGNQEKESLQGLGVLGKTCARIWRYYGEGAGSWAGPHGSNRTGRMFTGDASGVFLFSALHRAGFANQSESSSREDGLKVHDMLISAVCRCAPPENKPNGDEINNCVPYLEQEIRLMKNLQGLVALGRIAFDNCLKIYRRWGMEVPRFEFMHGGVYRLGERKPWLIASYHPSQQNTQTGRLTVEMFDQIWEKAHSRLV
jgi:uracil-DNA glycosylase family 4